MAFPKLRCGGIQGRRPWTSLGQALLVLLALLGQIGLGGLVPSPDMDRPAGSLLVTAICHSGASGPADRSHDSRPDHRCTLCAICSALAQAGHLMPMAPVLLAEMPRATPGRFIVPPARAPPAQPRVSFPTGPPTLT